MARRNSHSIKLLAPFLLLVGILVFIALHHEPPSGTDNSVAPSSGERLEKVGSSSSTESVADKGQEAQVSSPQSLLERESVANAMSPSQIQRGENSQLLYSTPSPVVREVKLGSLFSERLFKVHTTAPRGRLTLNEHTESAVEASLAPDLVARFLASDAESIRLPLSSDREVDFTVQKVVSRGEHTKTLQGYVDGNPETSALLVFHDGAVSGTVHIPGLNGGHYEFALTGHGNDIAIRKLDPATFTAACLNPGTAHIANDSQGQTGDEINPYEPEEEPEKDALPVPQMLADGVSGGVTTLDIVVGYGAAARASEGGVAGMEAKIMAAVDRTNLTFSNSAITNATLVLLGTVEDPDYVFPGETSDVMGSADELGDLNDTAATNPELNTVTNLRDSLGADSAGFVVNQTDGSAGVAYRPGRSMIIARTYMTSTRLTFVHEYGHNLGLRHAWADSSATDPKDTFNYGWRFETSNGDQVRTVMAYDWAWDRIPYFSNPTVQFGGSNTGAVDGYDATNDTTVDPRLVSGGNVGGAGAGYDGSNPDLGARNADYVSANLSTMATRAVRPGSRLSVREPITSGALASLESTVIFPDSSTKTFTIENVGDQNLTGISATITGADSSDFSLTAPAVTTLNPGATTTFQVSYTPSANSLSIAVIELNSNDSSGTFSIPIEGADWNLEVNDDFEGGLGNWSNSVGYDFNWTRDSNGTPSADTGPSAALDGTFYLFTEASGNTSKSCAIESVVDLSGIAGARLSFLYHMYGQNMGALHVDVFDGTSWTDTVWCKSGQQHSSDTDRWAFASVDLTPYVGNAAAKIRIRGITGTSFRSDMAIDAFTVDTIPQVANTLDLADRGATERALSATTVAVGDTFGIEADVINTGNLPTGGGFAVDYYLSTDNTFDNTDTLLGSATFGALAGGSFAAIDQTFPFPASIPAGDYYVGWHIDSANAVTEDNETNNWIAYDSSGATKVTVAPYLAINPTIANVPQSSNSGAISVTSNTTWSYTSSATWLTSGEAVSQTGSQNFDYDVAANALTSTRSGTISFTPTGGSAVTLTVNQAAATPEIAVNGGAALNVAIADGHTTPTSAEGTDFGSQTYTSGSITNTFEVTNSGTGALAITSASSSDPAFSVTGVATTIAASGVDQFTITFDPTAVGSVSSTITLINDDSDESPYTFTVTGIGTAPADDHGGSAAGATALTLPASAEAGNIEVPGDVDYFAFTITTPGTLTVWSSGNTDTVGELFDSSNVSLGSDDNGASNLNNFQISQLVSAGTYYVAVSHAATGGSGAYEVNASFVPNPGVTLTGVDLEATEYNLTNSASVTVTRSGATTAALNVAYTLGGSATLSNDYTLDVSGGIITIPAGSSSVTVTLTPVADADAEGDETATLTLNPGSTYALGANVAESMVIRDLLIDAWRFLHFGASNPAGSGDTEDPDNDGYANLMEYGLGIDPQVHDVCPIGPVAETVGGVDYLSMTYPLDTALTDIQYEVETTTTLATGSWVTTGIIDNLVSTAGSIETHKAQVVRTGNKGFLRLKITRLP